MAPSQPSGAARTVLVIGIGAGDPGHLTLAAVDALERIDVVFLVEKGRVAADMVRHRRALCDQVLAGRARRPRFVERTLTAVRDREGADTGTGLPAWRAERAEAYAELVDELAPGEAGAFLVWGDPTLYDGTLEILGGLQDADGNAVAVEVVPGISSVSSLAARHGVPLTRLGGSFLVTSGRRLVEDGWPDGVDSVVVMLDGHEAWRSLDDDLLVWWGAFVGMPDEVLVAGRLGDVRSEIAEARDEGRRRLGWMFDTYLLRRPPAPRS